MGDAYCISFAWYRGTYRRGGYWCWESSSLRRRRVFCKEDFPFVDVKVCALSFRKKKKRAVYDVAGVPGNTIRILRAPARTVVRMQDNMITEIAQVNVFGEITWNFKY